MTPKEQAKELFDKFCLAIKTEGDEFGYWTNTIHAKNCALIAVETLILNCYVEEEYYWQEVKEEIEKL